MLGYGLFDRINIIKDKLKKGRYISRGLNFMGNLLDNDTMKHAGTFT